MKKIHLALFAFLFMVSCSPSPEIIQKAIEQTQIALLQSITDTPEPTDVPLPTDTPVPSNTPTRKPTQKPTSTEAPEVGTFSNPFPFGILAPLILTSDGEIINFDLMVEEVIRGDEAWSLISQANMFNDPPPEGYDATLIKIYIANTGASGFLTLDEYDLDLSTKGNLVDYGLYSPCCLGSAGLIEFDAKLNPSGEHTGWVAFAVRSDDDSPMLVVGADYDGRGGMYFLLGD